MQWNLSESNLFGKGKIDFAAIELANLVKIKGVVLQSEIEEVCGGMSQKEISKVIRRLRKYKIEMRDGLLQYSKKVVGDAESRENELKANLTRQEAPAITSDMIKMGTRFYEGMVATGFPEISKQDWIYRLLSEKENIDFSIFITPEPTRNLEIYLQSQLKQVESELYRYTQQNMGNEELERKKKQLTEKLDSIAKGKYIMFKLCLYILSKGVSEDKAKAISKRIMSFMHSDGVEGKYATNYQKQLFDSVIPLATDFLGGRQIIANSTTIAEAFPFRK